MKPNKWDLLAAIHLLKMIESYTYTVKPIASGDSATEMLGAVVSTILTLWVEIGRKLKGQGYLRGNGAGCGTPTLLNFVVPGYAPGSTRDTVSVLSEESQHLSETCANLAGTPSPGRHNLNDDFPKCESAVQGGINKFLQHLKATDPPAFNKFIGDLVHY